MTSVQKVISSYKNERTNSEKYYSTFLPVGRQNIDLQYLDQKSDGQDHKKTFDEILKEKIEKSERH